MPNHDQLDLLRRSLFGTEDPVDWNEWRAANSDVVPDLNDAQLTEHDLTGGDFRRTGLRGANLKAARLCHADFSLADLTDANLGDADLTGATLSGANLHGADLSGANLFGATLIGATLENASLAYANISRADFTGADLNGADLTIANAVEANFSNADLTGCRVYGISAWGLRLDMTKQQNLVITPDGEPLITVDNVEVAQFIYLLLHNKKIRDAIDAITSKAVLILGRFTPARKAVLDALRTALRERGYLPLLFDFDIPATRDVTETVSLLAHMARFIVADLTEPSSIPKELEAIVPTLAVPVQPLMEGKARPFAMFSDYWKYDWLLRPHWYEGLDSLLATLADKVIAPPENKVVALRQLRQAIEAELMTPRTD
jgi:uncharacterized protein YjbI with pentapeptide repeats